MSKFIWQNGSQIEPAKVQIGNISYEVTPAQYEGETPLSATNLNTMVDNTYSDLQEYCVNAVNEGLLDKYSSEERVIGTWFGKPLYSKTFYRSSLINGTEETVNHGIANVDKIWQDTSKSFAIWPTGFFGSLPYLNNSGYDISIFVYEINSTSFKLKSGMDRSGISGYITFNYTKTTD